MGDIITPSEVIKHCKRHGFAVPANTLPCAKPHEIIPNSIPAKKPVDLGSGQVTALSVTLDLRTVSEANARGKGETRARMTRKKRQRQAARSALANVRADGLLPLRCGIVVTLTRHAPAELDEFDNLRVSMKAIVDGVADAYFTNDRDPNIEWKCDQVKSKRYAVEICLSGRNCAGRAS